MYNALFSRSALVRWLTGTAHETDDAISSELTSGLHGSLPIFMGGVINSIVVAAIAAVRHPTSLFLGWLVVEVALGVARLAVLLWGRRGQRAAQPLSLTLPVLLSCAWAASFGFGSYISIASEDWILAAIVCLSAAGMVSGICLRNFGTPRLALLMVMLTLLPCTAAPFATSQPVLWIITVQLPIYMAAIGASAFRLNRMMIARMVSQKALETSEAFNRTILEASPDYTLVLDDRARILFCNRPQAIHPDQDPVIGTDWFDTLPSEFWAQGRRALDEAVRGNTSRLAVAHSDPTGRRWFDVAISPIADSSGRILLVARDISHQKASEERAWWMANHDALTSLPNRVVLQNQLDRRLAEPSQGTGFALLVVDVDNFKLINDTLGHDAGDALLCTFANRLRAAVRADDLVARLGGDEFAIVLEAGTNGDVQRAVEKIYAELHRPFAHEGRLLECNASIGACLSPRDGAERSALMKAADVALYSAKSSGRGRLKIFESTMRNEVQARNSMAFLARRALDTDQIIPHYQPKVNLRTGAIIGFEVLLRWRDAAGRLCAPDTLRTAFDDPVLAKALSDRMIDRSLDDIRAWIERGTPFGHVAINAGAVELRSGKFADELLNGLESREIPANALQVEVTETVFLGRGADHVERALQQLSAAGVRIALDDFGTGYASLAHLMQFPVNALKIDQSFVRQIGRNDEAEAITKAIVNLGQSLDIEIIAEGIENAEQELYLTRLGCQTGQGFLYSKAVPAALVRQMVTGALARSA